MNEYLALAAQRNGLTEDTLRARLDDLDKADPPDYFAAEAFEDVSPQQGRIQGMANEMVERGLARREADKTLANMAIREAKFPDFLSLPDLLAQPDDDERWIVQDLLTYRGKILLAAQNKAGKTTLVGNLVRNLADGGKFLGEFDTEQQQRIVVIDAEMGTNTMRRWYRDLGITNADRVDLVPMRGKASSFNVLSDLMRSRWAEHLAGADVVILDCLRPVLDALGLDENHDAGRFLEGLDELMDEAGVPTYAVVHHMGHEGERARGDSRLLDWGDAVWNMRKDNADPDVDEARKPRFFSAYGRDVDVSTGQVTLEPADRSLTYLKGVTPGVVKNDAKSLTLEVRVLEALDESADPLTENALTERLRSKGASVRNGSLKPVLEALASRGKVTSQVVGRGTYYALTP